MLSSSNKLLHASAKNTAETNNEHSKLSHAMINTNKTVLKADVVSKEALEASKAVTKHAIDNHSKLTQTVAKETGNKDAAKNSSKEIADHARVVHNKTHGFDWSMTLIIILVAFLIGIISMFFA